MIFFMLDDKITPKVYSKKTKMQKIMNFLSYFLLIFLSPCKKSDKLYKYCTLNKEVPCRLSTNEAVKELIPD